jgi:NAD(P)H-flavin reductase
MLNEKFILKSDLSVMVRILDIIDEAPGFKTFLFSLPLDCKSGQFLMIWLPRVDEKPFTLSYKKDNILGIIVSHNNNALSEVRFNRKIEAGKTVVVVT